MHTPATPNRLEISWAPARSDDAAVLSDLFNAIGSHDRTPERISHETMAHELDAYFAPLEDRTMVGRDTEGEIVGYGTVYHRPAEAEEHRVYVGIHVSPKWRIGEVEGALTDWAVTAATDVLNELEATRKYLCAWLYKKQEGAAQRFSSRGFEPVRHWWEMERILAAEPGVTAESGFSVVPWQDKHSEPSRLVYNLAFADHWGSTAMDRRSWAKLVVGSPAFRQDYSFVAIADGDVVGYAANEVYPEDWEAAGRSEAWIGGLGVVSAWRKQGIATALLARSMSAMKADGIEAAMIGVDSASSTGAQDLYQGVGFETRITGTTWQREVD